MTRDAFGLGPFNGDGFYHRINRRIVSVDLALIRFHQSGKITHTTVPFQIAVETAPATVFVLRQVGKRHFRHVACVVTTQLLHVNARHGIVKRLRPFRSLHVAIKLRYRTAMVRALRSAKLVRGAAKRVVVKFLIATKVACHVILRRAHARRFVRPINAYARFEEVNPFQVEVTSAIRRRIVARLNVLHHIRWEECIHDVLREMVNECDGFSFSFHATFNNGRRGSVDSPKAMSNYNQDVLRCVRAFRVNRVWKERTRINERSIGRSRQITIISEARAAGLSKCVISQFANVCGLRA